MDPILAIQNLIILVFSAAIHEVSHAVTALHFGDDTAEQEGRITLNPLKHIDLYGSILMPFALMTAGLPVLGSAKPVPVNFDRLRPRRLGMILVSLAGPASNFILATLFALVLRFVPLTQFANTAVIQAMVINLSLGIFNILPIPPLDGGKVWIAFAPEKFAEKVLAFERLGFLLLIVLLMTPIFEIVARPFLFLFAKLSGLS